MRLLLLSAFLLVSTVRAGEPPRVSEPPPPETTARILDLQDEVNGLARQGKTDAALALALRAADEARKTGDVKGEASSLFFRVSVFLERSALETAIAELRRVDAAWQRGGFGPGRILTLQTAYSLLQTKDPARAQQFFDQALVVARAEALRPFSCSETLELLAPELLARGEREKAVELYQVSVLLREKAVPNSILLASSLGMLGGLHLQLGDPGRARPHLERAVELFGRLDPDSLASASAANNLSGVLRAAGSLTEARRHAQRAVQIAEANAAGTGFHAQTLQNLGLVAVESGELEAGIEQLRKAMVIHEKLDPESPSAAGCRISLGIAARDQGDFDAAESHWRRALTTMEKAAPESLQAAAALNNLGELLLLRGDLPAARTAYERSLAILRKLPSDPGLIAIALTNLGMLADRTGEPQRAEQIFREVLKRERGRAPVSLAAAAALRWLGTLAGERGELKGEMALYQEALEIQEQLAPDSMAVALTLTNITVCLLEQHRYHDADRISSRMWSIVRRQARSVSGDEALSAYGGLLSLYCEKVMASRLAAGRTADALIALEEGRAQALRQQLAERRLDVSGAPPERSSAYQAAVREQERVGEELARAGVAEARSARAFGDASARNAPAADLRKAKLQADEARLRRADVLQAYTQARTRAEGAWAQVKAFSPRAFPQAEDPKTLLSSLPGGTLYLGFVVSERGAVLLTCRGGAGSKGVRGFVLQARGKDLAGRVEALRTALTGVSGGRGAKLVRVLGERAPADRLEEAARSLYLKLFPEPVRKEIGEAKRLVVSPDGALWDLPFAALVTDGKGARHLGLEKPITYAQSLTLYTSSLAPGSAPPPTPSRPVLLAVGNPEFRRPQGPARVGETPIGQRRLLYVGGEAPSPLPFAEREARLVASLYEAQPFTGAAATEPEIRKRVGQADIVHLATHGYLHPYRAMSSGVLLAAPTRTDPPPSEDGALQAWEIFDQLKLHADLVVLSACETGLGDMVPGEGLIGLTRSLQVAGARSIVASQWQVADASTATLMENLHRELRRGYPKDEALRRSMAVVRSDPKTAHPYYWAGFLLVGDPENRTARVRAPER